MRTEAEEGRAVSAQLSRLTLTALTAACGITFVRLWTGLRESTVDYATGITAASLGLLTLAVVLGQFAKRHSRHRGTALLLAHAALTYLPVLIFGEVWLGVLGLLLGAVLAVLPRPIGLICAVLVGVSGPLITFCLPVANQAAIGIGARALVMGLLVYGVVRLASMATHAQTLREQSARLAVHRERVRMARDLHDLVGSTLSAITVTSAAAQTSTSTSAARQELRSVSVLARRALEDVTALSRDHVRLRLHEELGAAVSALRSASVEVDVKGDPPRLPEVGQTCLGAVLREASSNVLRHSHARRCSVTFVEEHARVTMTMENDGAHAPGSGTAYGTGLSNIAVRVTALGGTMNWVQERGRFHVTATLPSDPAVTIRYPYRVQKRSCAELAH